MSNGSELPQPENQEAPKPLEENPNIGEIKTEKITKDLKLELEKPEVSGQEILEDIESAAEGTEPEKKINSEPETSKDQEDEKERSELNELTSEEVSEGEPTVEEKNAANKIAESVEEEIRESGENFEDLTVEQINKKIQNNINGAELSEEVNKEKILEQSALEIEKKKMVEKDQAETAPPSGTEKEEIKNMQEQVTQRLKEKFNPEYLKTMTQKEYANEAKKIEEELSKGREKSSRDKFLTTLIIAGVVAVGIVTAATVPAAPAFAVGGLTKK